MSDDQEWDRTLQEATVFQMPAQLRSLFATICLFCHPSNPSELWLNYKKAMTEDFIHTTKNIYVSEQLALAHFESIFKENGQDCASFGLPTPSEVNDHAAEVDLQEEQRIVEENFAKLNNDQRVIVDEVLQAVNQVQQGDSPKPRAYFIDGPGGSGKTMVYNTLISWFRCNNLKVAASAWTGIAATLLAGGRTCHNLFKLPVPILDTSVCNISPTSAHAEYLRSIDMFLIDEASMVPTHALTAIDKMLQDITRVKEMFGGKIFVLGGDFRQVLPVVPRKPRSAIVEQCIKSSSLWQQFKTFRLTKNMRAQENEDDFSQWLLAVGNGETLCHDEGVPSNCISIPEQCHIANDMF